MNCKTCEYPLWNLTARQCPECGTPFRPSDYEFALNSVRFCCPDCQQPYYGTGDKGHLVPSSFHCVRCGRHLEMDEMVLLPTEGVKESQTKAEEMPWLVRRKMGRFKAWFATMGRAMADPGRLIELVPENRPASEAITYAVITNMIFLTTNFGIFLLPGLLLPAIGPGTGASHIVTAVLTGAALLVLLPLIVVLLWGVLAHLVLLITGETRYPIGRTFHAIGFSAGTNVLLGVPCMFFLSPIAAIWWIITAGIMLRRAQQLRPWRSVFAVGLPPALITVAGIGLLVLSVSSRATMARSARARAQSATAAAQTAANAAGLGNLQAVGAALFAMRSAEGGEWPPHGLHLMARGDVLPHMYTATQSPTTLLVPNGEIEAISQLDREQMTRLADRLAESLPEKVIAHRVGDVVFTYHGIDPADDGAERLWIAIEAQQGAAGEPPILVVFADGQSGVVSGMTWIQALIEQNALRSLHGLAPLPDPRTVTLEQPATGP